MFPGNQPLHLVQINDRSAWQDGNGTSVHLPASASLSVPNLQHVHVHCHNTGMTALLTHPATHWSSSQLHWQQNTQTIVAARACKLLHSTYLTRLVWKDGLTIAQTCHRHLRLPWTLCVQSHHLQLCMIVHPDASPPLEPALLNPPQLPTPCSQQLSKLLLLQSYPLSKAEAALLDPLQQAHTNEKVTCNLVANFLPPSTTHAKRCS